MTATPTDGTGDFERTAVLLSETGPPAHSGHTRGERPTDLGDRYVIIDELGAGGMGTVFRAYDPVLSREVAVKVLHDRALEGTAGQARMHREAQAMAQLSHPNVVAVYDVQTMEGGGLFVAMEFVAGRSLRSWVDEVLWPEGAQRMAKPLEDVLGIFVQAGRGLEEAHRVGLVHRDFKPGNVMVGDDGRVRVMDFGLARSSATEEGEALGDINASSSDAGSSLSAPLTQFGTVVGTPAYMAPEQHIGETVDARADQYAFCVALFEALVGERPFSLQGRGQNGMKNLLADKARGVVSWPAAANVPKHVADAVVKGMAPKADQRHASMTELIAALDDSSGRRRKRLLLAGGAGLALVSLVALARSPTEEPSCEGVGAPEFGTVWAEQRAAVEGAVTGSGLPHAGDSFERVDKAVDSFQAAWVGQRRDVCEASEVRREQSPTIRADRTACLERQLAAMEHTVEVMATDETAADRVVDLALDLPNPEQCSAERVHEATPFVPVDADKAEQAESIRQDLDKVRVLLRAARTDEAEKELEPVLRRARELEYAPVLAETLLTWGRIASDRRDLEVAYDRYAETVEVALSCGHNSVLAKATGKLVSWCISAGHAEGCDAWMRVGAGVAEAAGAKSPAQLDFLAGMVIHGFESGDWGAVVRHSEDGMRRATAIFGAQHPRVAVFENRLAVGYNEQGKFDEARVHYEHSLERVQDIYGKDHPKTTPAMVNYAGLLSETGELEEAEELSQRVLEIREAQYGEKDPKVANILLTMSVTARKQGKYELAEERLRRAIEIREEAYGEDHPRVAAALTNLSYLQLRRGDHDAAEASLVRAKNTYEALDPGHSKLSKVYGNLADIYEVKGEHDVALDWIKRAYDVEDKSGADLRTARRALDVVEVLMALERYGEAKLYVDTAHKYFLAAEDPEAVLAYCAQAEVASAAGEWPTAHEAAAEIRERLAKLEDDEIRTEAEERLEALLEAHPRLEAGPKNPDPGR